MTFLEPLILYGLPIALLPVIIHLFNRLRHRSIDWGAMMFLISATRKSTRYARLKQWLILLFRVLALLVLIAAISRPLAGGWIGWMLNPAPDAIIMVLDRSSSMEARMPGGSASKRDEAIRLLTEGAQGFQETSRLVLFDTALRTAQDIGDPLSLPQLSVTAPTDTAADLQATLQSVLDWVNLNKPGNIEIWVASDLQKSNWQPDGDRWTAVTAQLSSLPQDVRVRLLTLSQTPVTDSASIWIAEVNRRLRAELPELDVAMKIERNNPAQAVLPLTVVHETSRSQVDLQVEGQSFRYRHKVALESAFSSGWGKVEIPADNNPRDNVAYFVYGPPVLLKTAVISDDPLTGRVLQLAAAPMVGDTNRVADLFTPDKTDTIAWSEYALAIWNAPPPKDADAKNLREFMELGGSVLLFASGNTGQFEGTAFGEMQIAEEGKPWTINRWEEKDGPLAKTDEGLSLPLNELLMYRRQPLSGGAGILATFSDEGVFVSRRIVGQGEAIVCGASPSAEWSNLREGLVLVPLAQRLLQKGGLRFTQASQLTCGQVGSGSPGETWTALEGAKDPRLHAGVYRSGARLVAVNRPPAEDAPEVLEPAEAKSLFGPVRVQLFAEQRQGEGRLQSELWRTFLFCMVMFLLLESLLALPPKPENVTGARPSIARGGAA